MYPSKEWAAGVDRRLTQDRSDIDSLYEISERIEGKVDRLSDRMETRFEQVDARLDRLESSTDARFEQVGSRFDRVDRRFDGLDEQMTGNRVLLEQILERLDRD